MDCELYVLPTNKDICASQGYSLGMRSESTSRVLHAATGSKMSALGWGQEAAIRMLHNNLDPDVADGIFRLFQEINKKGTAILMATHNHELLRKYPYRVLKCENGLLLDSQTHDVSYGSTF